MEGYMGYDGATLSMSPQASPTAAMTNGIAAQPAQPPGPLQSQATIGPPLAPSLPAFDLETAALGRALMANFLRSTRTYDILPESSKVVVFDVAVPVKLAFYALVEHDIMCAPLWDAAKGGYAGLLTSSDLCDILRIFYTPGTAASALSELTIAAWREYAGSLEGLRRGLSSPQLYASPQQLAAVNDSIAAAAAPGSARAAGGAGGGRSGRHRSSISGAKRRRRIGGGSGGTDGALSDAGTIEELDDEDDDDGDDGMEGGASDGEGDDAMGGIGPTVSSASGSGARSRLNSSSSSASASAGVPRLSPRDVHMSGGGGMLQSPSLAAGFSPGGGRGQQHAGPWRGSRSGTVDSLGGALSTPRPGPELTAASRSSSGSSAGAGQLAVLSLGGSSAATGDASQAHSIATASSVTAGGSTSVSLSAGGGGGDPSSASVAMGGGQGGAAGVTPPGPHASGRRGRSGTVGSTGTGSPAVARRKRAVRRPPPRLVSIHPEDDLLTVSRKLRAFNIHHMPVHDPDTDAVIGVLSHRSLMAHVIARYCDATVALEQPLCSIGVGSFADIVVVPETASVISVLHVLAERQISSVPIVNPDSGALVDVYCRDDVAFLANDPSLMVLDAPVGDVRRAQAQMTGVVVPLLTCDRTATLHHALTLFAAAGGRAERVVCVDAARRVTGVVSLSDIFAYFARAEDDDGSGATAGISPSEGGGPGILGQHSSSGVFFGGGEPAPQAAH